MDRERESLRSGLVEAEKELEIKHAEISAGSISINRIQVRAKTFN